MYAFKSLNHHLKLPLQNHFEIDIETEEYLKMEFQELALVVKILSRVLRQFVYGVRNVFSTAMLAVRSPYKFRNTFVNV